MEDQPPSQLTQPYQDPRRIGLNNSGLSDADASDVLCILHPDSHLARKAVVTATRSSPEHVLQNRDILDGLEPIGTDDDDETLAQHVTHDIALRMSSSVRNPHMGFCFGRNEQRCDVHLGDPAVSGFHFRIYLNKDAILMLEDTSSNGTIVDDQLLLSKKSQGCPKRRTLVAGSIIKTVTADTKQEARFIVRLPNRDGYQSEYVRKLAKYMAYMDQVDRQYRAIQEAKAKGEWTGEKADLAKPILRLQDMPNQEVEPSRYTLASTSAGYTHGMQWGGGSKYNVVGQIGKGAFATVYKLTTKNDGRVFAAKELDKRRFMKNGILDMKVDNEMKIMKGLRHPNIVQYVDYHDHEQWLYIIMEYIPAGELSSFTQKNGPIPEVMVKTVARQILHALDYLHRRKITHRDIKPDNILISSFDPLRVKLSDFGLSKVVNNQETFLKTFCGTLLYCAPEVYPEYDQYRRGERKRRRVGDPAPKTSPYSQAVDMWSFGAVLFHVLCNHPPYIGRGDDKGAQMLSRIMTTEADFDPLTKCGVSDQGIDFISRLLNRDPMQRPREKECFQHPWISDVPDEELMEIEVDDLGMEDAGLMVIEEGDEEELDASKLHIEDDLGVLDFYSEDDENVSVDELEAFQSKRPRLGESRIDSQTQEQAASGNVRYPVLPAYAEQRPGRLFGEITESALRSSGLLGQGGRDATADTAQGSRGEQIGEANSEEITSNDGSVNHYLRNSSALPIPSSLGGSAPSLFGAEALVGQLQMESPNSAHSPISTPNTNNPVTPETPNTREVSPGRSSHPPPSDTDSTPKVPRLSRQIDLDLPVSAEEDIHNLLGSDQHEILQDSRDRVQETHLYQAHPTEMGPDLHTRFDPYLNPDTEVPPSDEDAPQNQEPEHSAPSTSANDQIESNGFAKPYRCLGKITTLPGSFADIKFRLEHRLTSWGRGTSTTVQYPDPNEIRIPKFGLEITFWTHGIEQKLEEGEDWTKIEDIFTVISTKTSKNIWVNDVKLRSETPARDGYYYGKLYTGDIITVHKAKEDFLKFKAEIYHGLSAMARPEAEKPFMVEITRMKNGISSQ